MPQMLRASWSDGGALEAILSNSFNLGAAERRRYRVNSAGRDRLSEALTYLVFHENRISRLLDLIFWSEFGLVASEGRGAPVVGTNMPRFGTRSPYCFAISRSSRTTKQGSLRIR
jgi:hypothetical protein